MNNVCQFLDQFNRMRNSKGGILDLILANFCCKISNALESFIAIDNYYPPQLSLNAPHVSLKFKPETNNFKSQNIVLFYQTNLLKT